MLIREPKFKIGEKVMDEYGFIYTVIGITTYSFSYDEYWYKVEDKLEKREMPESILKMKFKEEK